MTERKKNNFDSDVRNSWEDETVCWMRVFLKTFSSGPRTRTFLFGFDHGDFIKLFNFQDKASKKPNTGQTRRKKIRVLNSLTSKPFEYCNMWRPLETEGFGRWNIVHVFDVDTPLER